MPRYCKLLTCSLFTISVMILTFYGSEASEGRAKARELARELAGQKRMQQEEFEILVSGRIERGLYYYKKGEYQEAVQQLNLALEIDPTNNEALSCLNKALDALRRASKEHYARGLDYYNEGKMQKTIDELIQIPSGDPYYEQAQEYIAGAENMLEGSKVYGIESPKIADQSVKDYLKQVKKDEKSVMLRKKAYEKKLMLDVESSYLPPEMMQDEEEVDEETEEEIADRIKEEEQKKLIAKMNENVVPALSLSDADIRDVIRELVKLTGVNIILDESAVKRVSEGGAVNVSFTTVTPMPLMELLNIALKTTNLAYKVETNYIWISDVATITKEELVTRTYKLKYGVRRIREISAVEFGEEDDDEEEGF